MCVVSMVGDHYNDKWKDWFPQIQPINIPSKPNPSPSPLFPEGISRREFNELKKEVEEMKKLLIRAKEYDEKNNEPNCEMEDKIKLLREVARLVGVDLDEIFKPKET